jgi:8-oxo-dGTP diphosphatase
MGGPVPNPANAEVIGAVMEIRFYGFEEIENSKLKYAVIYASHRGSWILAKHRERSTWETQGGHREPGEDITEAAKRELYEESGATAYELEPVCVYSVTDSDTTDYGALFYADVRELGPLPECEMAGIKLFKRLPRGLTYPDIFPKLFLRVMDHLKGKYIELLGSAPVRNVNIIQFLKSYPVYSFDRVGESVLIRGTSDEDWVYISSGSEEEFGCLTEGLDEEDKCFAVLEDWMLPAVIRGREVRSRMTSMKLVYGRPGSERTGREEKNARTEDVKPAMEGFPAMNPGEPEVTDLTIPDASVIYNNSDYKEYISIAYIEERILNGVGAGIRKDGRLVAWALTHDDGAIGFMHVLGEYRRRGYALRITEAMVSRLVAAGEVPFVHIKESNAASMELAVKAGFRKDRRIHWIKLA